MLCVSLSPCRRSHPAGVVRRVSQAATAHAAFTFPDAGSASGAAHFRGHRCVRLRYGLETRPHPKDEVVERLQKVGFPSPCSPSYRALAFPLVGLSPTEHASLSWTHNRTYNFRSIRLSSSHTEEGKGSRYHTDPYPLLAGKPASLRHGALRPLETVFPSADSYGSSVTLGLSPRRPSRSSLLQHVRA